MWLKSFVVMDHDDFIKWKYFPRYWPFVRGIHRSRWIPHTKASDAELWCFIWSARIYSWVNNWEAGDLRRHCTHFDVNVMQKAVYHIRPLEWLLLAWIYPKMVLMVTLSSLLAFLERTSPVTWGFLSETVSSVWFILGEWLMQTIQSPSNHELQFRERCFMEVS